MKIVITKILASFQNKILKLIMKIEFLRKIETKLIRKLSLRLMNISFQDTIIVLINISVSKIVMSAKLFKCKKLHWN